MSYRAPFGPFWVILKYSSCSEGSVLLQPEKEAPASLQCCPHSLHPCSSIHQSLYPCHGTQSFCIPASLSISSCIPAVVPTSTPLQSLFLQKTPQIFMDKDKGTTTAALPWLHGEKLQILPIYLCINSVQGCVYLPTYIYLFPIPPASVLLVHSPFRAFS